MKERKKKKQGSINQTKHEIFVEVTEFRTMNMSVQVVLFLLVNPYDYNINNGIINTHSICVYVYEYMSVCVYLCVIIIRMKVINRTG